MITRGRGYGCMFVCARACSRWNMCSCWCTCSRVHDGMCLLAFVAACLFVCDSGECVFVYVC